MILYLFETVNLFDYAFQTGFNNVTYWRLKLFGIKSVVADQIMVGV